MQASTLAWQPILLPVPNIVWPFDEDLVFSEHANQRAPFFFDFARNFLLVLSEPILFPVCMEPQFIVCGVVLIILSISGAFGGILSALSCVPILQFLKEGRSAYGNRRRLLWVIFLGGLFGVGSAISAGIILYCDGKLDTDITKDAKSLVLLSSLGVIAGFSGIRLLRIMSGKLEKRVEEIDGAVREEKKITAKLQLDLKKQIQRADTMAEDTRRLAEALSFAGGILGRPDKGEGSESIIDEAIEGLETVRGKFPAIRSIGIYLGRLYRRVLKLDLAITVLSEVLETRRRENLVPDKDDAALLFNRACYKNLRAVAEPDPAVKSKLEKLAIDDLKEVEKISPHDFLEAQLDSDLKSLFKNNPLPWA
ncbi:MAG: hypothetical protein ACOYM3_25005 [Terrimicrobiaceae bacterium]